jgi:hypothetical protein
VSASETPESERGFADGLKTMENAPAKAEAKEKATKRGLWADPEAVTLWEWWRRASGHHERHRLDANAPRFFPSKAGGDRCPKTGCSHEFSASCLMR